MIGVHNTVPLLGQSISDWRRYSARWLWLGYSTVPLSGQHVSGWRGSSNEEPHHRGTYSTSFGPKYPTGWWGSSNRGTPPYGYIQYLFWGQHVSDWRGSSSVTVIIVHYPGRLLLIIANYPIRGNWTPFPFCRLIRTPAATVPTSGI